jgi:AhpD family alkylhydroperoxidase
MKKLLFLIFVLGASIINACPSCIGYDHQRKLRRQAADIQQCNCDCQRQYHTTPADNDKKGGHWCRMCQHRYIPSDPLSKSKIPDFLNPETSDLIK